MSALLERTPGTLSRERIFVVDYSKPLIEIAKSNGIASVNPICECCTQTNLRREVIVAHLLHFDSTMPDGSEVLRIMDEKGLKPLGIYELIHAVLFDYYPILALGTWVIDSREEFPYNLHVSCLCMSGQGVIVEEVPFYFEKSKQCAYLVTHKESCF